MRYKINEKQIFGNDAKMLSGHITYREKKLFYFNYKGKLVKTV
jgi:hypothetical protein